MEYSFIKSLATPFDLRMVLRALTSVRIGVLSRNLGNYALHEHDVWSQNKRGKIFPTLLYLELTTYCSRNCRGCYIPQEERDDNTMMTRETAHNAIKNGASLGVKFYNFLGGEPVAENTVPLMEEIVGSYPSLTFITCTNGDYIAARSDQLDGLALRNNFSVALSIDGFEGTNDRLRGRNSFRNVVSSAAYLRSRRALFGAVVTLRKLNFEEAISPDFTHFLIRNGFIYVSYAFSDELRGNLQDVAIERIEKHRDPIFKYTSLRGHMGERTQNRIARTISIGKDGSVFDVRKERRMIGTLEQDLEGVSSNRSWLRKFVQEV